MDPFNPELITTFEEIGGSHNIMVYDGYLYIMGAEGGDLYILSLEDPQNPILLGIWEGEYLHDICFFDDIIYGCGIYSNTMYAINVSDKNNPFTENLWTNVPSAHACWVTDDGNILATASETQGGHIMIWDVSNLDDVDLITEWAPIGSEEKSAHNVFIRDQYMYISYYVYGLQIVDISNPEIPELAGSYDTYPGEDGLFNGAWGTYPFQTSCNIYISDRETGLYVVQFSGCTGADPLDPLPPQNLSAYSDYLTPETILLEWNNTELLYNGDSIISYNIEIYRDSMHIITLDQNINQYQDSGLYDGTLYSYQLRTLDISSDSTSGFSSINRWSGGNPIPEQPSWISVQGNENQALLQWESPDSQEDGSPLDDLEFILIRRNGSILDSLISFPGQIMEFIDTPPLGYQYTYILSALDNETNINESEWTLPKTIYVGEIPNILIWSPLLQLQEESLILKENLEFLNQTVSIVNDLNYFSDFIPTEIDVVFSIMGVFPNNYTIDQYNSELLIDYIENGGNLYIEGSDWWYENYDTELFDYFGIEFLADGNDDLEFVSGFDQCISENMEFNYIEENNWIDRINAKSPAFPILFNPTLNYTVMVGNNFFSGKTIGSSLQLSGLNPQTTRIDLLDGLITFFTTGIGHSWEKGDVNKDGNLNILDIVYCVEFMLTITLFYPDQQWMADINHDNEINIQDILLIVQQVLN